MARVKNTGPTNPSPSKSHSDEHSDSSRTQSPTTSPLVKRVSKPTQKVIDKGKKHATEVEKKRKAPPQEKLMKDAMKSSTSAQKPKKQKRAFTSEGQSEDLLTLIPDPEAREIYLSSFESKKIHDARVVDFKYFDENSFTFQDHLRFYGMIPFLTSKSEYYPRLIRVFYSNFKLMEGGFKSEVKGKKIYMTFSEFATLSELQYHGTFIDGKVSEESEEGAWEALVNRHDAVSTIMVDGFRETTSLPAGQMKVQHRLLLYVLSRILVPRTGNYGVIQGLDLTMLWGMIHELPMSWAWIVLINMKESRSSSMLPYPQLITKILKKFKIPLSGEKRETTTYIFGETTINKMPYKKVNGEWVREIEAPADAEAAQPEVLAKLLELIASQAEHNEQTNKRLERIEESLAALTKHLFVQVTFDDIADIGVQAAQEATTATDQHVEPPRNDNHEPHGEETPTETNTVVSTSTPGDNEGQD